MVDDARSQAHRLGVQPGAVAQLGGDELPLVPAPAVAAPAAAAPQADARRDYELALQVGNTSALNAFLRHTRYGLIIRAGVENRAMVTALGIDVRRAFTLVFAIGGVAAWFAPVG